MTTIWKPKDPAEHLVATFHYLDELDDGETIVGAIPTCTLISGTDANPSALLSGDFIIAGGTVLQPMSGGSHEANYKLRCIATLSSGRVLVRAAILPVRTA